MAPPAVGSILFISINSTNQFVTGGSDGKESACNAGDLGSVPGPGRSPGEGMATRSSILAWRIPWAEEPGGLHIGRGSQSQTQLND